MTSSIVQLEKTIQIEGVALIKTESLQGGIIGLSFPAHDRTT